MKYGFYNGYADILLRYGAEKGSEIAAAYASRLGFDSVEMIVCGDERTNLTIPDVRTAEYVRNALTKEGLTTSCYSVGATLYRETPVAENPVVAWMKKQIEITAALGCPYFHHTLLLWCELPAGAPPFRKGIDYAVDCAAVLADYAATFGITCLYEDQGLYANGVAGYAEFYSRLRERCRNIGVCGDAGNTLFVDEDPLPFFRANLADIRHVHIKDYIIRDAMPSSPLPGEDRCVGGFAKTRGGKYVRDALPGDGDIDIAALIRALRECGYDGTFSLEFMPKDPEKDFPAAMRYLDSL